MAQLDKEKLNVLKKGEIIGNIATVFCGVVLVLFIAGFAVAQTQKLETLRLVTLILAPALIVAGACVSAFCNIKFGGGMEKLINDYVKETLIENAASLHPEKNSLSFYLELQFNAVYLKVNGYKEGIIFDFSPLGKFTFTKKISAINAVENRLICTFCRLYERGGEYIDVSFAERAGTRKKSGKTIYVIQNGKPDNKAFKTYLKLK